MRKERSDRVARGRELLAPAPIALLRDRAGCEDLPPTLERLGIRTLGDLAALPAEAVADRFGQAGLRAHEFARGLAPPPPPPVPRERIAEWIELSEAAGALQLEHALGILVHRLLGRPELRGHTIRALCLVAHLVEDGVWRVRVSLRQASATEERLRLAAGSHLCRLPAPAERLALEVEELGPPPHEQTTLLAEARERRRVRLDSAIHQARAVSGPSAVGKIAEVDPGSRVPERRMVLEGQLNLPRGAAVLLGADGAPTATEVSPARGGTRMSPLRVESVREEWLVEDRWWTERPLRRRYFELALEGGRNAVVFEDLRSGRWFAQRA